MLRALIHIVFVCLFVVVKTNSIFILLGVWMGGWVREWAGARKIVFVSVFCGHFFLWGAVWAGFAKTTRDRCTVLCSVHRFPTLLRPGLIIGRAGLVTNDNA